LRDGLISAVHEAYDQRQLLLATLPPSKGQIRAALGIVAALLVAFVVTVPYVNVQLSRVDAFVPTIATATVINDLITSVLLFSQFSIVRQRALLVLASGYLFTALIVIPWALAFPGLFAPTGLLGAGLQTTVWLYILWHVGSPLVLIVFVLLKYADSRASTPQRSPVTAIGLSIAIVIATVCGLTWVAIAGEGVLPRMFLDDVHFNRGAITGTVLVTLNSAALALLWVRRRSVLNLWLMVMCCAWLFEAVISVLIISARFSLGWYAGRIFGLIATFVVLLVLLSETLALYANLARAIIIQRSDRNARQIAMDAMAASIVHEIKQPLGAIVTNANAGLSWLKRATPDLNEACSALDGVVNNGHRVNEIVGGIRSMFKKGAHGQISLDVNELVRETLTMTDLDADSASIGHS
jgi:signal transduction histidine kinase